MLDWFSGCKQVSSTLTVLHWRDRESNCSIHEAICHSRHNMVLEALRIPEDIYTLKVRTKCQKATFPLFIFSFRVAVIRYHNT